MRLEESSINEFHVGQNALVHIDLDLLVGEQLDQRHKGKDRKGDDSNVQV